MTGPGLQDTLQRVENIAGGTPEPRRGWAWARVLEHCAQSIEYSIDGFPKPKPAIIRATIGRLVARRFLQRGALSHDLQAAIPGAETLSLDDDDAALTRLREAVARFEAHTGPLADHFVFGKLAKADYGRLHAMHIEDHLGDFVS
ncbi:MAG: DUF1569 domain-containing protein [Myxococcota bacterium]